MNKFNELADKLTPKTMVESAIRIGVIAILAVECFRIAFPFIMILTWATMLAIMLYPLHQKLARKMKYKQGMAATLMVVVVILLVAPPIMFISSSLITDVKDFKTAFESGELVVAAPDSGVKDWPLIGERAYTAWSQAAEDLPAFLESHATQIKDLAQRLFSEAGAALGTVLLFLAAFIIAGIMMAFAGPGERAMTRIFSTLINPGGGPRILSLVVGTIRSVATGVLGVAFIQALLFGIGFALVGIPMAGLLALLVMFIAIIQVPAAIVGIPVIIWLWVNGDASVGANIFFSIYFLIAAVSDNVLKPLLLGRGVEAPMPVILIGALGGMIAFGLLGLFYGAMILAVVYKLFMTWTDGPGPVDTEAPAIDSEPNN